jgi:hypothetical protein
LVCIAASKHEDLGIKVKVKVTLEQATKVQRESRSITGIIVLPRL